MLDCAFAVRHVVLWKIWLHRNERIFQRATTPLNLKEVLLECKYVTSSWFDIKDEMSFVIFYFLVQPCVEDLQVACNSFCEINLNI